MRSRQTKHFPLKRLLFIRSGLFTNPFSLPVSALNLSSFLIIISFCIPFHFPLSFFHSFLLKVWSRAILVIAIQYPSKKPIKLIEPNISFRLHQGLPLGKQNFYPLHAPRPPYLAWGNTMRQKFKSTKTFTNLSAWPEPQPSQRLQVWEAVRHSASKPCVYIQVWQPRRWCGRSQLSSGLINPRVINTERYL